MTAGDFATQEGQDAILQAIRSLEAPAGIIPTFVANGRMALTAGQVTITLHASTVCSIVRLKLDRGASAIHVNHDGSAASDATPPKLEDDEGWLTIVLATPAKTLVVFALGAVGYVNWVAGN